MTSLAARGSNARSFKVASGTRRGRPAARDRRQQGRVNVLAGHDPACGRDPRAGLGLGTRRAVQDSSSGGTRVVGRRRGKQEHVGAPRARVRGGSPAHGLEGP
eukprot:1942061-Alexandrium_andersonii.AAC.1